MTSGPKATGISVFRLRPFERMPTLKKDRNTLKPTQRCLVCAKVPGVRVCVWWWGAVLKNLTGTQSVCKHGAQRLLMH